VQVIIAVSLIMVFGYFVDTILYTAAVYAFLSGYEFGCYRATPQGAAYRAALSFDWISGDHAHFLCFMRVSGLKRSGLQTV